MKQFFKFLLASILGVILGLFIISLVLIGIASAGEKKLKVADNSVLNIDLNQVSLERNNKDPFSGLNPLAMSFEESPGLYEVTQAIKLAKDHDKIKGINLNIGLFPMGYASATEVRKALEDFKSTGKFVYVYSEIYSQKAYYLASVADRVFLNPMGNLEFKGLGTQITFFTKALENIGVEMQIIRHGKFKSAVEPFMLTEMSEANRLQTQQFLSGIWNTVVDDISTSRKISEESLQSFADRMSAFHADSALSLGFVDGLIYQDQYNDSLKAALGIDDKKVKKIDVLDFLSTKPGKGYSQDKIAIVFAQGEIISGNAPEGTIGSDRIAAAVRKARENENVKAVVLRINSPGGSALASDVIWREIKACSKVKPVIASLGDVAASGGYYIACAADTILAHPSTITGSIGVFGMIPNLQNLSEEKIGLRFDEVKTAEMANFGSLNRPLSEGERDLLQNMVENTYSTFLSRVSDGRGIPTNEVDSIGQGRVWSGVDGKNIGLVDGYGSLSGAIKLAAEKSGLSEYRLVEYPELKDPIQALVEDLTGSNASSIMEEIPVHDAYLKAYKDLKKIGQHTGVQTWLPYTIYID